MKKKILCGILVGTTIPCTACQSPNPDKAMSLQEEIPEVLANAEYENLEILFDEMEYYEGQELAIAHMERYDLYANFTYKELMEYYANEVFPRLLDVDNLLV